MLIAHWRVLESAAPYCFQPYNQLMCLKLITPFPPLPTTMTGIGGCPSRKPAHSCPCSLGFFQERPPPPLNMLKKVLQQ